MSDLYQAEDCLIKAFCKIFKHIESFRGESNPESWARRIVVNECLNFIKSHKTIFYLDEINQSFHEDIHEAEIDCDFNAQELLDQLPDAYRMVLTCMCWKNILTEIADTFADFSGCQQNTAVQEQKRKIKKDLLSTTKKKENENV